MNISEMKSKNDVTTGAVQHVDFGLRQYMLKVFNYMSAGLVLTGLVAYLFASNRFLLGLLYNPVTKDMTGFGWLVTFAPLIVIFVFNYVQFNKSLLTLQAIFWTFSALMGASLSWLCSYYTGASITRVFLIAAATFTSFSLYGYTTQRNLTSLGGFMFMGLIGLIIATLVNAFMESSTLQYALSYIGIVVFVGLTAYDTQKIKYMYYYGKDSEETTARFAVAGALSLYLDFINLFLSLLRLLGDRR